MTPNTITIPTTTDATAVQTPAVQTEVQTPAVQTEVQTPAVQTEVQTPAVQTPAVQTPAVQTPAVQTPAVQTPTITLESSSKVKASDMPKGLSMTDAIKWKNNNGLSLNKTETFFLFNSVVTDATNPAVYSLIVDAFKPKEGAIGIGAKNWDVRIALLIQNKEIDIARFVDGFGWYYTPINNETLKADKKSPINSNGGLKSLASTVNYFAGIAEDYKESLVNKMIDGSATAKEIVLIPSLTVKNAQSVKDAEGIVTSSKFDVQLGLVQRVFTNPLTFTFQGDTISTVSFEDKFTEYRVANQTDAYFLGATKEEAYNALLGMSIQADSLKLED